MPHIFMIDFDVYASLSTIEFIQKADKREQRNDFWFAHFGLVPKAKTGNLKWTKLNGMEQEAVNE